MIVQFISKFLLPQQLVKDATSIAHVAISELMCIKESKHSKQCSADANPAIRYTRPCEFQFNGLFEMIKYNISTAPGAR